MRIFSLCAAGAAFAIIGAGAQAQAVHWTRNGAPAETYISGGPWTLEQSGAAVGLKSAGYCDRTSMKPSSPRSSTNRRS
jgi:hypothetical protein